MSVFVHFQTGSLHFHRWGGTVRATSRKSKGQVISIFWFECFFPRKKLTSLHFLLKIGKVITIITPDSLSSWPLVNLEGYLFWKRKIVEFCFLLSLDIFPSSQFVKRKTFVQLSYLNPVQRCHPDEYHFKLKYTNQGCIRHHTLLPTPTVCGHAEACPSTTYAK